MGWRIYTGQSEGYELADEAKEAIDDAVHGDESNTTTVPR